MGNAVSALSAELSLSDKEGIGASASAQILVADEDSRLLRYIRKISGPSHDLTTVESIDDAVHYLSSNLNPDIVIVGLELFLRHPEFASQVSEFHCGARMLLMAGVHESADALTAVRRAGRDILLLWKPFGEEEFEQAVVECLADGTSACGRAIATREYKLGDDCSFVFGGPAMEELHAEASLIGRVDVPVLILGESGTGKEVLARYLHSISSRAKYPFYKVNCAAMPVDLLESELFGYEQGAFTGAVRAKPGKFELCNHSTILLDEIGEMHPSVQAKLLHVLQDGTFSRLGGKSTIKVDVRIMAATNVDIREAITRKEFREDVYYRLNGFTVHLPPLRRRKQEIPVLLNHFLQKAAGKLRQQPPVLSPMLMEACMKYDWPGNLRELENFAKRILVFNDERMMVAELQRAMKSQTVKEAPRSGAAGQDGGLKRLVRNMKDETESDAIARALERTSWNRKQAAADLGISYKALLYKVRQYGLTPPWQQVG